MGGRGASAEFKGKSRRELEEIFDTTSLTEQQQRSLTREWQKARVELPADSVKGRKIRLDIGLDSNGTYSLDTVTDNKLYKIGDFNNYNAALRFAKSYMKEKGELSGDLITTPSGGYWHYTGKNWKSERP